MRSGVPRLGTVIACAVVLAACGRAVARTGETVDECAVRYGEIVGRYPAEVNESDDEGVHFRRDYTDYFVEFKDGEAWSIKVVKRGLPTSERDALLEAEEVVFDGPEDYGAGRFWISELGAIHASESVFGRVTTMRIVTRDYLRALAKAQERRLRWVGTEKGAAYYSGR